MPKFIQIKKGLLINADLNSSYSILRKAVPNAYADVWRATF